MLELFHNWFNRRFSDPHVVALVVILLLGSALIYFFGNLLAPLMAAIVIAYLLDWPVNAMTRRHMPRAAAASVVILLFIGVALVSVLGLLPRVTQQGMALVAEMPEMFNQGQTYLMALPQEYPELVDTQAVTALVSTVKARLLGTVQTLVSASFTSLVDLAGLMIYLVLVPLLVFFLLKDKDQLLESFSRYLPRQRRLANQVWMEVNKQILNYVRGKFLEILIVGVVTFLVFVMLDLRYSALLATLVGFSVLIPYIGAAIVTIPIAVVGLFQWGMSAEFGYLMLAYGVIQMLDGNVLVPILFSEALNLHPVSIIVAVLVFGGLWGFWGVFFAIPLATLVKAVVNAMPEPPEEIEAG